MAVLNITPTMDLSNIDTINTPNASQMLNTNNTVPHHTIQCLLYEVFFNTIYLDSTPKHLLHIQEQHTQCIANVEHKQHCSTPYSPMLIIRGVFQHNLPGFYHQTFPTQT
eukprot:973878_1